MTRLSAVLAGLALPLVLAGCGQEQQQLKVSFGYADNASDTHQPAKGAFPSPWQGSPNVNFVGQGPKFESGAIRIENPSEDAVTVQQVTLDVGEQKYDLWGSNLKVPGHGSLILTQTAFTQKTPAETNFDTSELTTGPGAAASAEPVLHLRANGKTLDVRDAHKILTTGGHDIGNDPGNPNESHGWQLAATVNVDQPGQGAAATDKYWWAALAGGLIALLSFLPALIGGLLLLLIAWFLARWIARAVAFALAKAGLDAAVARHRLVPAALRTGETEAAAEGAGRAPSRTLSWLIGWLVALFVFGLLAVAVAQALHLTALVAPLSAFILFLPNLLVGILILVLGLMLARILARLVFAAASSAGLPAGILAMVVQALVIFLAATAALTQVGIGASLMQTLFTGICIALALALGLAFGLGGQDTAREVLNRIFSGRRQLS